MVASSGDTIFVNVQGPTGWTLTPNSFLQVIVSQANWPGQSQGLTPFANGYVLYSIPMSSGTLLPDGVTSETVGEKPAHPAHSAVPRPHRPRFTLPLDTAADSLGDEL